MIFPVLVWVFAYVLATGPGWIEFQLLSIRRP
jgi:hypothetical protein